MQWINGENMATQIQMPQMPTMPPAPGQVYKWEEWDIWMRWHDMALRTAEGQLRAAEAAARAEDIAALQAWRVKDLELREACAANMAALPSALDSSIDEILARWSDHDNHVDALAAAVEHMALAVGAIPAGGAPTGTPGERAELMQAALAIYQTARASDPSPSPDAAVGEARGLLRAIG